MPVKPAFVIIANMYQVHEDRMMYYETVSENEEMSSHFGAIAHKYKDIRTTDREPIVYIKERLLEMFHCRPIPVLDVGCGDGRYDKLLLEGSNETIRLTCLDSSGEMLSALNSYLKRHGIMNFETVRSSVEEIPLEDSQFEAIISFNAFHHFSPFKFFSEARRLLKPGGMLFIYSRTPTQNRNTIWGRFFPEFVEKEVRLKTPAFVEEISADVDFMDLVLVKFFIYKRKASVADLIWRATNRHYSTFAFYEKNKLRSAIRKFKANLLANYENTDEIEWIDSNVLYQVQRT